MLQRLERIGLGATRALSVAGLLLLMALAALTLADGLLRWLANKPIEGVRHDKTRLRGVAKVDAHRRGMIARFNFPIAALVIIL